MPVKYAGETFISLREYIEQNSYHKLYDGNSEPLYAHPVDRWIIASLNATPMEAVISKAVDTIVSVGLGYEISEGVFIDQRSFPELYQSLADSAKTLGIQIPHAVARHDLELFNAYTAGTDEYALVNVSSGLCQFFTQEEVGFVIGHECGHIACGHMVYHTLAQMLTGAIASYLGPFSEIVRVTAGIPLLAWARRSEITADRAGLLCCGQLRTAERALLRLVTGLADIHRVDIEDYLKRFNSVQKFHGAAQYQALLQGHPLIPRRILALRQFADSELYYELSGRARPMDRTLLNRENLNKQVNQVMGL